MIMVCILKYDHIWIWLYLGSKKHSQSAPYHHALEMKSWGLDQQPHGSIPACSLQCSMASMYSMTSSRLMDHLRYRFDIVIDVHADKVKV